MTLKIFNTLTRKKEDFKPLKGKEVKFYVCGPTIYDHGHLGHGRSAINFDIIRRYLVYKGFEVKFVFNYTDIDDNMINRANKRKITVKQLADEISKIYDEDYKKLVKILEVCGPISVTRAEDIQAGYEELQRKSTISYFSIICWHREPAWNS